MRQFASLCSHGAWNRESGASYLLDTFYLYLYPSCLPFGELILDIKNCKASHSAVAGFFTRDFKDVFLDGELLIIVEEV